MSEKKIDIKAAMQAILTSEYSDELCELFTSTLLEEIQTDDEPYRKIGRYIMEAVLDNNINDLFIALCGWSLESLMKKSNLICDTDLTFHDEICEASFVSMWDGGTVVETPCKVNMTTHEVFDIVSSESSADQVNVLDREFVVIGGNEYPVFPHDEAERYEFGAFWYGEDE